MPTLIERLLAQGDYLCVENGRLILTPASGKEVPNQWLVKCFPLLVDQMADLCQLKLYQYQSYSTGTYDVSAKRKQGGVSLRFLACPGNQPAYAIFNASIRRARTTKAGKMGDTLPDKQFHPAPGSAFVALWRRCNLPIRNNRLTEFHKRMGLLKPLLFMAECSEDRLSATSIQPFELSYQQLMDLLNRANSGDKEGTRKGQGGDNLETRIGDKDFPPAQTLQGFQPDSSACPDCCVLSKQDSAITREAYSPSISPYPERYGDKRPNEQTTDEWLHDFETGGTDPPGTI